MAWSEWNKMAMWNQMIVKTRLKWSSKSYYKLQRTIDLIPEHVKMSRRNEIKYQSKCRSTGKHGKSFYRMFNLTILT